MSDDDAELRQLRHERARLEVLGRQEVRAVAEVAQHAVDHELVRQAARLRARAAVGAAAADGLAGQALARVRDAERAVDEDLELRRRSRARMAAMSSSDSSRARMTRVAPSDARELDAGGVGARHLRRGVDGQLGRDRAHELARRPGPAR